MPTIPYTLAHGASWILPDGRVIKIPGFHSSWLASHPALASGATDTAEFVKKSGWLSAVLHEKGYLELIVRSAEDPRQLDCLWSVMETNRSQLGRVTVMVLGKAGCAVFEGGPPASRESFVAALQGDAFAPE